MILLHAQLTRIYGRILYLNVIHIVGKVLAQMKNTFSNSAKPYISVKNTKIGSEDKEKNVDIFDDKIQIIDGCIEIFS